MSNRRTKAALSTADEVLILLRQIAVDIAAIRQGTEGNITSDTAPPGEAINPKDLITPQQAAGIAEKDASTMRRWYRETPNIGTIIGGTLFFRRSKVLERLAVTKHSTG